MKDDDCKGSRICVRGACAEPDDDASVGIPPAATGGRASGGSSAGGIGDTGGVTGTTVTSEGGTSHVGTGATSSTNSGGTGGIADAPNAGCKTYKTTIDAVPVDAYVMFDQSSSMRDPVPSPGTGTWWEAATKGLSTFAHDTSSAGLSLGLQYFPLGGVAPASCSADYATAEVDLAVLPGNTNAIDASLAKHDPNGFTPSGPALVGAIAHMKAWASKHSDHIPAVVFVTDGFPTECSPVDPSGLAQLAKAAFETDPQVRTYVVGLNLGPGKENLNQIAKAGGTDSATFIDGGDVPTALVRALQTATSQPGSCTFGIPAEGRAEPWKVSLTHAPPSGVEEDIPRLNTLGDCTLNDNRGFYFDSLTAPAKLIVCPASCRDLGAGTTTIGVGCRPPATH